MGHSKLVTMALALGLALGLMISSDAQQRSGMFTTARLTDTSANSLLVGCTTGTTCTGGIRGGPAILSVTSAGGLWLRGINGTTNGVELHMRPSSGKKAYLTMTEDTIADRWAIGTENGDGNLYFRSGLYTDSADATLSTAGALTLAGHLVETGSQNTTTTTGAQVLTLSAGVAIVRLTSGGDASDDQISHITGGTAGRIVTLCYISETAGGDGPITIEAVNTGTAADRIDGTLGTIATLSLKGCKRFIYDGASSRWLLMN